MLVHLTDETAKSAHVVAALASELDEAGAASTGTITAASLARDDARVLACLCRWISFYIFLLDLDQTYQ